MLFKSAILDQIRTGAVTLAFRRWRKPSVREGLRTQIGVLAIDRVEPVTLSEISESQAAQAGFSDRSELLRDLRSRDEGAFYRIEFHRAGTTAGEIAEILQTDRAGYMIRSASVSHVLSSGNLASAP